MAEHRFNLSAWALANRPLIAYFMVVLGLLGAWSYPQLGQSEDPPFTFKVMVVKTLWPGASAQQMAEQITDRIEAKLQEMGQLDFLRSYSKPGESVVFFNIREDLPPDVVPEVFYQVRKKIGDLKASLPQGAIGPFFNDEFGDTFGNIYALTGADFTPRELKDYADRIRDRLLQLQDVSKVALYGVQSERFSVTIDNIKRASLGIPVTVVMQAVQAQNAVTPAGYFETSSERIYLRVSGRLKTVEDIRQLPIRYAGRTIHLGDVATVTHGYASPPDPIMHVNGQRAIGLGVSMIKGGDILRLGEQLEQRVAQISQQLPLGMQLTQVADQPAAVSRSVDEFVKALAEAVVIVLLVSFFTLGLRTGLVVALAIPLVLAMTFFAMYQFDIGLQKVSLGALVLALGLLVDDAIIAVEMMAIKMEQGLSRLRAAAFAYTSTAFPMLTGTLVTAAGFLPIAIAQSSTGEYTRSIFEVVTIALLLSWVTAVVFVPWLGYKLLPKPHAGGSERETHDPYQTRFYRGFRHLVSWCVRWRWLVIILTAVVFVGSLSLFRFVPKAFFPESPRLILLVDLTLPQGASLQATQRRATDLEAFLAEAPGVDSYMAFIGSGAPRFYLSLVQQLPAPNVAQFVLNVSSLEAREQLREQLIEHMRKHYADIRWRVQRLVNGPPVDYPVEFRLSGYDVNTVQAAAHQLAAVLRDNAHMANVNLDWGPRSKVLRVQIDQARARALGVTSKAMSEVLYTSLHGAPLSYLRRGNDLIEVQLRGPASERQHVELLGSLAIPTASGQSVLLSQVATIQPGLEDGVIWRRDRLPTVTVRGDIYDGTQPPVVTAELQEEMQPTLAAFPPGIAIAVGGTVEQSVKGQSSVMAGMPLLALAVLTILMIQLRNFSQVMLVVLTAPLGLIGVALAMLIFQAPFGFVSMLGSIALSGMIMRNSVILVDQIKQDLAAGYSSVDAVVNATVRRFRPIVLTALAAVLAMIPLTQSGFFMPMAVAMMGGLIGATILTLLFLPALYAAWYRLPRSA